MKPILFNADMVRAILGNRKTVTRRVAKRQPGMECTHGGQHEFIRDDFIEGSSFTGFVCKKCGYGVCGPHFKFPVGTSWIRPPYCPGDILYVRETWSIFPTLYSDGRKAVEYLYKADMTHPGDYSWCPSIHMPREAARIFLRVTNVRVERLQDITEAEAVKEGFEAIPCDHPCGYPCTNCMNTGYLEPAMLGFVETWNSTLKPSDRALYGWDANPWVWVIEFERVSKEVAEYDP